jgi:hypothetical protein
VKDVREDILRLSDNLNDIVTPDFLSKVDQGLMGHGGVPGALRRALIDDRDRQRVAIISALLEDVQPLDEQWPTQGKLKDRKNYITEGGSIDYFLISGDVTGRDISASVDAFSPGGGFTTDVFLLATYLSDPLRFTRCPAIRALKTHLMFMCDQKSAKGQIGLPYVFRTDNQKMNLKTRVAFSWFNNNTRFFSRDTGGPARCTSLVWLAKVMLTTLEESLWDECLDIFKEFWIETEEGRNVVKNHLVVASNYGLIRRKGDNLFCNSKTVSMFGRSPDMTGWSLREQDKHSAKAIDDMADFLWSKVSDHDFGPFESVTKFLFNSPINRRSLQLVGFCSSIMEAFLYQRGISSIALSREMDVRRKIPIGPRGKRLSDRIISNVIHYIGIAVSKGERPLDTQTILTDPSIIIRAMKSAGQGTVFYDDSTGLYVGDGESYNTQNVDYEEEGIGYRSTKKGALYGFFLQRYGLAGLKQALIEVTDPAGVLSTATRAVPGKAQRIVFMVPFPLHLALSPPALLLQRGVEYSDDVALANGTGRVIPDNAALAAMSSRPNSLVFCLDFSGFDRTVNAIDLYSLNEGYRRWGEDGKGYRELFGMDPKEFGDVSRYLYGARYADGDVVRRQPSLGSGRLDTSGGGSVVNISVMDVFVEDVRSEALGKGITFGPVIRSVQGDDTIAEFTDVTDLGGLTGILYNHLQRIHELGKDANIKKTRIGSSDFLKTSRIGGFDAPRVMGASPLTSEDFNGSFDPMQRLARVIGLSGEAIVRGSDPHKEERFLWGMALTGCKYFVRGDDRHVPKGYIIRRVNHLNQKRSSIIFPPSACFIEAPAGGGVGLVPGTIPGTTCPPMRGMYYVTPEVAREMEKQTWIASLMQFKPRPNNPSTHPKGVIEHLSKYLSKTKIDNSEASLSVIGNRFPTISRRAYRLRPENISTDFILGSMVSTEKSFFDYEIIAASRLKNRVQFMGLREARLYGKYRLDPGDLDIIVSNLMFDWSRADVEYVDAFTTMKYTLHPNCFKNVRSHNLLVTNDVDKRIRARIVRIVGADNVQAFVTAISDPSSIGYEAHIATAMSGEPVNPLELGNIVSSIRAASALGLSDFSITGVTPRRSIGIYLNIGGSLPNSAGRAFAIESARYAMRTTLLDRPELDDRGSHHHWLYIGQS